MCNYGAVPPEGIYRFEPADPESAEAIAALVAARAGSPVCPLIRQCHSQCMSITNKHAGIYPLSQGKVPDGIDPRICNVFILCEKSGDVQYESIAIPEGMLAGDTTKEPMLQLGQIEE